MAILTAASEASGERVNEGIAQISVHCADAEGDTDPAYVIRPRSVCLGRFDSEVEHRPSTLDVIVEMAAGSRWHAPSCDSLEADHIPTEPAELDKGSFGGVD